MSSGEPLTDLTAGQREPSAPPRGSALALAIRFHEAYERLAPLFGYETRPETRNFDPQSNNGRLMVAVCREIIEQNTRDQEHRMSDPGSTQDSAAMSPASAGSLANDPLRGNAMNDSARLPYGYENNVTCTTDKTGRMVINWPEGCRGTVISRELLDDIVEDKNNRPRWIPATERPPDLVNSKDARYVTKERYSDPVLVFDGSEVHVGTYGDVEGWLSGHETLSSVTHWMPLPAPPADAK